MYVFDCSSNVENISVSLEALYQTLHINLQSNLYGTYLYSAYPVMVTMGTIGVSPSITFFTKSNLTMRQIGSANFKYDIDITKFSLLSQLVAHKGEKSRN